MINDMEDDVNETAKELGMDATAAKESYGQPVNTDEVSNENTVDDDYTSDNAGSADDNIDDSDIIADLDKFNADDLDK